MKFEINNLRHIEPQVIVIGNYRPIIQSILDFDFLLGRKKSSIKGIIKSNKKNDRYFWGQSEILLPFYKNLDETPKGFNKNINYFLNLSSARRVESTTNIALSSLKNLSGGVIFGENTPEKHTLNLLDNLNNENVFVIGPSSVGLLIPGVLKLGAIGGVEPRQLYNPVLYNPGNLAVFSSSGGITNELINIVTTSQKRMSFCFSFGADRFPLTSPTDAFIAAENDPNTTHLVYFGELGGTDEYDLVELIKKGKVKKPVITYIGGSISSHFPTPPQFGHAKALAKNLEETAEAKTNALKNVGASTHNTFSDFVKTIGKLPSPKNKDLFFLKDESLELHNRKKAMFASSISDENSYGINILDTDQLELAKKKSFSYIVASMLLGKKIKSIEMEEFSDLVLKLLVDNGPSVSGAVNTMIAARAGKDLVSSLTAGLLTIGKRFGGAVNGAALNWLKGNKLNNAKLFVENNAKLGKPIEGIGHKKYRIDNPDPRVVELLNWSKKLKHKKYLNFAKNVEEITLSKKANLILNVDGTMAAIFLDILSEYEGYTENDLLKLTEVEFFNAFFVLPRSVGFMAHYFDQVRLDEGLFRLPVSEVANINIKLQ